MNNKTGLFLITFFLFSLGGCYAKGPWRGTVIDAETKEPIRDASVIALWSYEHVAGPESSSSFLDAEETATNEKGEFDLPFKVFLSIPFFREVQTPGIFIYKPGYEFLSASDYLTFPYPNDNYFLGKRRTVELLKTVDRPGRIAALDEAQFILIAEDTGDRVKNYNNLLNSEKKFLGIGDFIKGNLNKESITSNGKKYIINMARRPLELDAVEQLVDQSQDVPVITIDDHLHTIEKITGRFRIDARKPVGDAVIDFIKRNKKGLGLDYPDFEMKVQTSPKIPSGGCLIIFTVTASREPGTIFVTVNKENDITEITIESPLKFIKLRQYE